MSLMMLPLGLAVQTSRGDAELVASLQRRDPQALAELYDRYGRPVYSLILRLVGDSAVAEDAVQEIFCRVWNRIGGLDPQKGSIGPWLIAIAHRRAIEHSRSTAASGASGNCEELRESYEMYALGAAGEPERGEIRAHLDRGCEVCTSGVRRAIELAALPAETETAADPPARLRRRILASAGFEQKRFGWAPFWAAAAVLLLAAAVYFSGRERQFAEDVERAQDRLRAQTSELAHLNQAFAVLDAPDTMAVSFGEGRPVQGEIFANRSGVLLIARNLPAVPAGMALQMWVIPKGAKPQPAGLFRPDANGAAMHLARRSCAPGDTVAVTVENESGADRPTAEPIIVAPMAGGQQ
jgi:RNA polymerase sigma-70 factor (ECF subfamily)